MSGTLTASITGPARSTPRIEYSSQKVGDNESVHIFHDIDEKCRFNYLHCLALGKSGYTKEKFVQSNAAKSPKEIFACYKKR